MPYALKIQATYAEYAHRLAAEHQVLGAQFDAIIDGLRGVRRTLMTLPKDPAFTRPDPVADALEACVALSSNADEGLRHEVVAAHARWMEADRPIPDLQKLARKLQQTSNKPVTRLMGIVQGRDSMDQRSDHMLRALKSAADSLNRGTRYVHFVVAQLLAGLGEEVADQAQTARDAVVQLKSMTEQTETERLKFCRDAAEHGTSFANTVADLLEQSLAAMDTDNPDPKTTDVTRKIKAALEVLRSVPDAPHEPLPDTAMADLWAQCDALKATIETMMDAIPALAALAAEIEPGTLAAASSDPTVMEEISALAGLYTMESERAIHNSALAQLEG